MRIFHRCGLCLAIVALAGCTHIAGVVVDDVNEKPLTSAIIAEGRPDGIATPIVHHVDSKGRFDLQISGIDENNLYVYDGASDPRLTMRRIDQRELSAAMQIRIHRAAAGDAPIDVPSVLP